MEADIGEDIRKCVASETILSRPLLYLKSPPRNQAEIENLFLRVSESKLRDLDILKKQTTGYNVMSSVTPHVIGLSCLHRLANAQLMDGNVPFELQETSFGSILFSKDVRTFPKRWENQLKTKLPLSGVLFVTSQAAKLLPFFFTLIENGGTSLGTERTHVNWMLLAMRGSARLISEQILPLAIHTGEEDHALLSAERNCVFSITLRTDTESSIIVTTGKLENLDYIFEMTRFEPKERMTRGEHSFKLMCDHNDKPLIKRGLEPITTILVFLGLKDYKLDNLLYSLALYLNNRPNYEIRLKIVFDSVKQRKLGKFQNPGRIDEASIAFENVEEWEELIRQHCPTTVIENITDNEKIEAMKTANSNALKRAIGALSVDSEWKYCIGPVMACPQIKSAKEKNEEKVELLPPISIYGLLMKKKVYERITLPVQSGLQGSGIQITSQLPDTKKLLEFSEAILKKGLPALHIPRVLDDSTGLFFNPLNR